MYLTWGYNLSNAFQVYLWVVVVEGGVLSLCSIHGWKQTARTLQTAPTTPTDIITAVAHSSEQAMHIVQFTTINYSVQSQQQQQEAPAGWLATIGNPQLEREGEEGRQLLVSTELQPWIKDKG